MMRMRVVATADGYMFMTGNIPYRTASGCEPALLAWNTPPLLDKSHLFEVKKPGGSMYFGDFYKLRATTLI
jgi:hypothetical protein